MTPQQKGRLGGLTAAHNMTPQERTARAMKGGQATVQKYGKAHFVRLSARRKRTNGS